MDMLSIADDVTGGNRTKKRCMACKELIQHEANLCPHCRSPQSPERWKKMGIFFKWLGGTTVIISLLVGMLRINDVFQNWRERQEAVDDLVKAAGMQKDSGDYSGAWMLYEQALDLEAGSRIARQGQVQLTTKWLRNIRIIGKQTFTEIVVKLLPVLYRGLANTGGEETADILAHIGWANYLRYREGMRDLKVTEQFENAIKVDPDNVYAHAMFGGWILYQNGTFEDAMRHFEIALKSGREKEYARDLKLSALLNTMSFSKYTSDVDKKVFMESVRMVDDMRKNQLILKSNIRKGISNKFSYSTYRIEETIEILTSIVPPGDLLATFLWLGIDKDNMHHRFWHARLTEATGDLQKALSLYRSLQSHHLFGTYTYKEKVLEGITRLPHSNPTEILSP